MRPSYYHDYLFQHERFHLFLFRLRKLGKCASIAICGFEDNT